MSEFDITIVFKTALKTTQPKGRMCVACKHKLENCSQLSFDDMPVIKNEGDVIIVKCTEFKRGLQHG